MSFSRLMYDQDDSRLAQASSMKAASYYSEPPVLKTNCLQENPRIMNQHNGVSMPRNVDWRFYTGPVDIESDLMGVHRIASRCPSKKYVPGNMDGLGTNEFQSTRTFDPQAITQMVNTPCEKFPTEDTRLSNPSCNLRGTGINRFEDLCLDPQANIFIPTQVCMNTRMMAKDNYRPRPTVPKVNNMNPNMGPLPCKSIPNYQGVCANYTTPLTVYNKCG